MTLLRRDTRMRIARTAAGGMHGGSSFTAGLISTSTLTRRIVATGARQAAQLLGRNCIRMNLAPCDKMRPRARRPGGWQSHYGRQFGMPGVIAICKHHHRLVLS